VSYLSDTSCTVVVPLLGVTSTLWDWFPPDKQWYVIGGPVTRWCYGATYCSAGGFESGLDAGRYKVTGAHYCSICVPQSVNTSRIFNMP